MIKENTKANIKPGYKKTSVGMIPEDWEVKRLGDYLEKIIGGGTPSRLISEYWDGEIPWATVKDFASFNPYKTQEYISNKGLKESSANLIPAGTLITATRMGLGKVSVYNVDVAINQDLKGLFPKKNLKTKFLYYWFINYQKYIESLGTGSTVKGITLDDLKSIRFLGIPLPEQEAIADCLSTWDKGIEKLSALIASKKEQKKGLMQGIFSGELKVENGELVKVEDEKLWLKGWKEVRLGEIGTFRTSSVNKKIVETETKVWLLNYMDVYKNTHITSEIEFQQTSAKDSQIESSSLKIGDILFTPSSETPDDIGHSAVVTENLENVVFSYHLVRFRVKKNLLDIDFSGHVFNKSDILNEFSRRATGSTRYTLSLKDFNEVTTKLPELKEQAAIAEVLITADKEIELLEQKLESFKIQKKGLMQVLLTGEKRLVES